MKNNTTNLNIKQKAFMAVMGLTWIVYLAIHAIANISFFSATYFNEIYQWLNSGIFWRYIVPTLLVLSLFYHMFVAIKKQLNNLNKQPPYKKAYPKAIPRIIAWSGVGFVLLFLILHIYQMQVIDVSNMHQEITILLNNYIISGIYLLATIALLFHIEHGLSNVRQTLGINLTIPKIIILIILALGYILPIIKAVLL